ncbi:hypothetical protein BDZ89DRAFT_1046107 [Hymenopellis radicata]|nr:hypothetical protein BDZ89DRAFT_1046107 [Hymenopellis radicata]
MYVRDFYLPYYSFTSWYALAFINAVTVRSSHGYYFPRHTDTDTQAAAPTMIIGRVMFGEARPNDSWRRPSLPHMRTSMRSIAESIRFTSFRAAQTQDTAASTVDLPHEPNHGSHGTNLHDSALPLSYGDSMTANGAFERFKKQDGIAARSMSRRMYTVFSERHCWRERMRIRSKDRHGEFVRKDGGLSDIVGINGAGKLGRRC